VTPAYAHYDNLFRTATKLEKQRLFIGSTTIAILEDGVSLPNMKNQQRSGS